MRLRHSRACANRETGAIEVEISWDIRVVYYTFHGFHRLETERRSENTFKRNWVLLNAQELNIQMCPFCFEGQTVLSASARTCTWSEYGISTHFYRVRVSGIVYQS